MEWEVLELSRGNREVGEDFILIKGIGYIFRYFSILFIKEE